MNNRNASGPTRRTSQEASRDQRLSLADNLREFQWLRLCCALCFAYSPMDQIKVSTDDREAYLLPARRPATSRMLD